MRDDELTPSDYIRLGVILVVILLCAGTFIMACRSDAKVMDARAECLSKHGVWYRDERVCLDIKTIPLKEP